MLLSFKDTFYSSFKNITHIIAGKQLHCLNFGTNSHHMCDRARLSTSCLLRSCFFLKSTVCSAVRVKRWWRGCGCAGDAKGLLWPRPALQQNTDSLFRPTHESHHRRAFGARQGGGMGGSMYTRCCNGLLLD